MTRTWGYPKLSKTKALNPVKSNDPTSEDKDKDQYLDWLKAEVQKAYGRPAYYVRTEAVHEAIEGNTVWLGEVEVFGLIGHAQAKRCFAWGHDFDRSDTKGRVIAVLETPSMGSAQHAVRLQLAKDLSTLALQADSFWSRPPDQGQGDFSMQW